MKESVVVAISGAIALLCLAFTLAVWYAAVWLLGTDPVLTLLCVIYADGKMTDAANRLRAID